MSNKNIFISNSESANTDDISGKITYTNIMDIIPTGSTETRLNNWEKEYNTEWRWRFMELPEDRLIVEMSYTTNDNKDRIYFNRYGKWVKRDIDPIYDNFVTKQYYYYSNS